MTKDENHTQRRSMCVTARRLSNLLGEEALPSAYNGTDCPASLMTTLRMFDEMVERAPRLPFNDVREVCISDGFEGLLSEDPEVLARLAA